MNISLALGFVSIALATVLLLFAVVRQRRNLADWSFLAAALCLTAEQTCGTLGLMAATSSGSIAWQQWRLLSASFVAANFLVYSLSYSRGSASLFLRRWRWSIAIAFLAPLGLFVAASSELMILADTGLPFRLSRAGFTVNLLLLTTSVAILMNLERTFRAAVGTLRWRIKFTLLGVGVLFVVRGYTASQGLLFRGYATELEAIEAVGTILGSLVIIRGFFRGRHFQTEVYPSHSVLAGSLTIALAGSYLLVVGLFAEIVSKLGGDASFALKTFVVLVALIVLAILLQSDRVRLCLRRLVSRHFQRPIYDYRAVWKRFTEATGACVDQAGLSASLVRLTAELFQALSVSLWILDPDRRAFTLAASTSVRSAGIRCADLDPSADEAQAVIQHFSGNDEVADIDSVNAPWAAALRRWQPTEFVEGGHRYCVSLRRRQEIVGFLVLGDRVGGVPLSDQDLELLRCIADQATASLLNVQLSQRVGQAKEIEAFQSMAAFFVHDLKNATSTLTLMLQNLPIHFGDPAFRADALRGIGKTVDHMNGLVSRLSQLRTGLQITPVAADPVELVRRTVASLAAPGRPAMKLSLSPAPPITFDPDQVQKVIVNLILNAADASPPEGEIRISLRTGNDAVILSVADDGCGMSPEFVQHSLFRPFKTSKRSGLGIGLFQSKTIIEAHGGRIAVRSALTAGTTFDVYLPLCGNNT